MANLTIAFVMVIMYIVISAVAPLMGENIAPQPADNDADALAPSPTVAFLEKCVEKFTDTCGSQVFDGVFRKRTVTAPCCMNLLQVGKPCHDELVKRIVEMPWFKRHVNESQVLSQSEEIWSKCASDGVVDNDADALAPSPIDAYFEDYGLAPSPTDAYLEKCVKNYTNTCGSQVFDGVFRNMTVTAPCCMNLLQVGKPCHDGLVKRIVELPWITRHVNESQVLAQSEEIWSKCASDGVAVLSPTPSPSSF